MVEYLVTNVLMIQRILKNTGIIDQNKDSETIYSINFLIVRSYRVTDWGLNSRNPGMTHCLSH